MEARGKQAAQFYSKLRNEVVALFAVFTAGRGIKDFVRDITNSDAATGRLAKNLNISVESLSTWRGAAERAGGSAQGIDATLQGLADNFQQLKNTGQSSVLPFFRSLGVQFTGTEKDLDGLNRAVQGMDRQEALYKLRGAGIDASTSQMLLLKPEDLKKMREESARLAPVTKKNAENAAALERGLINLKDAATGIAREVLNVLSPTVIKLIKQFEDWLEITDKNGKSNRELLSDEINKRVGQFVAFVEALIPKLVTFATEADAIAQSLGGWIKVSEVLFGLWAGAKFMGVLRGIGLLRGALGLGAIPTVLGLPLALKGDTDADATPDGFREGHVPNNGPGASTGPVSNDAAQQEVDRINREQAAKGPLWKRALNWAKEKLGIGGGGDGAREVMDFFISKGRTREQAAGIAGNLQAESSTFDPQAGRGTAHQGIAQWDETRRTAIEAHFRKPIMEMSRQEQLEAMHWEMTEGARKSVGDRLSQETTTRGASMVMSHGYEAPGNYLVEDPRRLANADAILAAQPHAQSDAEDVALSHLGQKPQQVNSFLKENGSNVDAAYTAWCAAFVNSALKAVGIEGSGSNVATSFLGWGKGVASNSVSKGDVLVQARGHTQGQVGGHVGMATGRTRMMNGRQQIEMTSGNYAGAVSTSWENADALNARRMIDPVARPEWYHGLPRGGAGSGAANTNTVHHNDNSSENNVNGPITIHTAATDAAGIAGSMGTALRSRAFLPQANAGLA